MLPAKTNESNPPILEEPILAQDWEGIDKRCWNCKALLKIKTDHVIGKIRLASDYAYICSYCCYRNEMPWQDIPYNVRKLADLKQRNNSFLAWLFSFLPR